VERGEGRLRLIFDGNLGRMDRTCPVMVVVGFRSYEILYSMIYVASELPGE
jgi:hypothetical protein